MKAAQKALKSQVSELKSLERTGSRNNDWSQFHQNPTKETRRRSASVSNPPRLKPKPKSIPKPSNPPKPQSSAKPTINTHRHKITEHSHTPPDPHSEEGRKKIANDTMNQITQNLKDPQLNYHHSKGETIDPNHYNKSFQLHQIKSTHLCQIEVQNRSAYGVAKYLVKTEHYKTAVLNFASATKPGGGFLNGRNAQEESLSRQSSLYYSLKSSKSDMYDQPDDNYYTDYMIYSPNIHVFKDDVTECNLPKNEQFFVNVITSAAPNRAKIEKLKSLNNEEKQKLYKILLKRCRKIVICAIDKGNVALVLGAYGCGVFGNNPDEVSSIFRKILVEEGFGFYLKKVVFAIPGSKDSLNFREFKKCFP